MQSFDIVHVNNAVSRDLGYESEETGVILEVLAYARQVMHEWNLE